MQRAAVDRRIADPFETLRDGCFSEDDFADRPDGYFDALADVDPNEIETVRLQLKDIESTEELSQAFLDDDRDLWCFHVLHDELRRACSGSGELSRLLANLAGFDFIVGRAETLAFSGDGPLSTPLVLTSVYPDPPAWSEEIIKLNAPYRQDALELLQLLFLHDALTATPPLTHSRRSQLCASALL